MAKKEIEALDKLNSHDDAINTLLGTNINFEELSTNVSNVTNEIQKVEHEALGNKILTDTDEILQQAKNAITDVLLQVQTTPNDGELVAGAAHLIKSVSGLIGEMRGMYATRAKFQQQLVLQTMKLQADDKMNRDNNATRILMSREEILSALSKEKDEDKVVEQEDNTKK